MRALGNSRTLLLLLVDAHAGCAVRSGPVDRSFDGDLVGPTNGTLIVAGGGRLGPEIMGRFVELAGGEAARIVIIPTAGEQDTFPANWSGLEVFRSLGVRDLTVLHTRDPRIADRADFVEPLRRATGVWIPGGRQWRLADAYNGTRALRELNAVLDRGGVIGGTSAGASIQPTYMVRGAPEGNHIMMAAGHEEGFGFLRDVAVDQHLLARNRQDDLLAVVERYPHLLGIGIDEGTAIVVARDRAEVIGRSRVAFYNTTDADGARYYYLEAGDVFDLARRRTLRGERIPVPSPQEREAIEAVQALFDAMRQKDTAAARQLFHPAAHIAAPSRSSPAEMQERSLDEFLASLVVDEELDERMVNPRVRADGPLAAVWTPYTFHRGGRFSHCGTDAVHLVRDGTAWRILHLVWTRRTEGCPTQPASG